MSLEHRRRFLQFLAGSPLAAATPALAQALLPKDREADPRMWGPYEPSHLIKDPKEAINVFDFEPVMRQKVPPAHFGYMASGIDDEVTLRANREDFLKFQLRPRRLVDVSKVDMSVDILGTRYPTPIVVAPVGGQKAFHAEGEIATARGSLAFFHKPTSPLDTSLVALYKPALHESQSHRDAKTKYPRSAGRGRAGSHAPPWSARGEECARGEISRG